MAAENKIGELYVDITGRDRGASAALDRVKGKAGEAGGSLKDLGDQATRAQGFIAKLLMPAALIGSITGAVAAMMRLVDAATKLDDKLDEIEEHSEEAFENFLLATRGAGGGMSDLNTEYQKFIEQQKEVSKEADGFFGSFFGYLSILADAIDRTSAYGDSVDELTTKIEQSSAAIAENGALVGRIGKQSRDDKLAEAKAAEDLIRFEGHRLQLLEEEAKIADDLKKLREKERLERIKDFERENEAHRQRMKDLKEYEEAIRNSIIGGLFGGGAVAGGDVGAVASALGQIADKLGGAR